MSIDQVVDRVPGEVILRGGSFVIKDCTICGKQFQVLASRAAEYKTCSRECTNLLKSRSQGGRIMKTCTAPGCTNTYTVTKSEEAKGRGAFCSNACRRVGLSTVPRKRSTGIFGIHVAKNGQLRGTVWDGDVRRAVFVHRYQAEQELGRKLHSDERVVFINGNENSTDWHNLAVYDHDGALIAHGSNGYVPPTYKEFQAMDVAVVHAERAS